MGKEKNDLTAKIVTLIIAIFLWSFVMSEVNPEISREYRNVTVNLSNMSALDRQGLVVMEPQDVKVNIKVTGKKTDMDKFSTANITAQVDLSGYSEGKVKIPVTVGLIDQLTGVRVLNYEPREILFTLDKLITKEVPLTIQTTGSLPDNYVLGDIISKSQSLLLKGPRTWVNEVDKVIAIVDLSNRTAPDTVTVATIIVDDGGNEVRGVEKEPSVVDITIPVYRTISLPIELQTENELPENFSITDIAITPSRITVKGDNSIVNLQKINTKVININTLLDKAALEVELDLPEGVELVTPLEKVTIIYNIEETISKEYTLSVNEINAINLDPNLVIKEEDLSGVVKISLKGLKSVLDTIENEDLDVSIDLKDLTQGEHDVELIISEIQGVTVEAINPQPIILNLDTR